MKEKDKGEKRNGGIKGERGRGRKEKVEISNSLLEFTYLLLSPRDPTL